MGVNKNIPRLKNFGIGTSPTVISPPVFEFTNYGFRWGGCELERLASDSKRGWIVLGIKTRKHKEYIQICVTKTGKVKVNGKENDEIIQEAKKCEAAGMDYQALHNISYEVVRVQCVPKKEVCKK